MEDKKSKKVLAADIMICISGWLVILIALGTWYWYITDSVIPHYFYPLPPDLFMQKLMIDGFRWGWIPGVVVSIICVPLGIGLWNRDKSSRLLCMVISCMVIVFPFLVPASYGDSFFYFLECNYFIIYPIVIIVLLSFPRVKEQFKETWINIL